MKRIVLIDECYPINTRNQRIIDSLASAYGEDAQLEVITWDRNNEYRKSLPRYHVYRKASAYGNRVKKFFNMWGFYRFSRSLVRAGKPDVVIDSHWTIALRCLSMKTSICLPDLSLSEHAPQCSKN